MRSRSVALVKSENQTIQPTFFFSEHFQFSSRQEGVLIPHVVRCCVEEVERRGMDEVGIYRISGTTSEISTLKAAFNSSKKTHRDLSFLLACVTVSPQCNSDRAVAISYSLTA